MAPAAGSGPAIRGFSDPAFDAFAEWKRTTCMVEVENPYPHLAALRREAPIHKGDVRELFGLDVGDFWRDVQTYTVVGYEEALEILNDPVTFSNSILEKVYVEGFGKENLHAMDPPLHTAYRKLFQRAFLPKYISRWRDELLPRITHQFIDTFAADGRAELIEQFCKPFPFRFIFGQLDLPRKDQQTFHALATALICTSNPAAMAEASRNLGDYLHGLLEARKGEPGDDMISVLGVAEADGARVPDEVIVSFLRQLLTAGGGTTFHATGTMLTGLLADPAQWQAVLQDRTLAPKAVQEALRWDSPSMTVTRMATRDVEVGGVRIPRGARLVILVSAINRHTLAGSADEDRYDIFRPEPGRRLFNLAFSQGPHICIGRHLAQMEMAVALGSLMDRLPNLRLDPDRPPPRVRGLITRSPDALHVVFDGA